MDGYKSIGNLDYDLCKNSSSICEVNKQSNFIDPYNFKNNDYCDWNLLFQVPLFNIKIYST